MISSKVFEEEWLATRLMLFRGLSLQWDAGEPTADERRERLRAAVMRDPEAICARSAKSGVLTFRGAFERIYQRPLEAVRVAA